MLKETSLIKIKEEGVFLQVWMTQEQALLIPSKMTHDTSTNSDFMVLGNEREKEVVNKILATNLDNYCFDYILVNLER